MKAGQVLVLALAVVGLAIAGPGPALTPESNPDFVSDGVPGQHAGDAIVQVPVVETDAITWVTKAASPSPGRYWCPGTGVVRDTIYFMGGRESANGGVSTIWGYDVASNTWISSGLPSLITGRRAGCGGQVGNKIYAFGGRSASHVTLSTCEVFDVDAKTVTAIASMPTARWASQGDAAGGKLYVVGSENRDGTTYEYDPGTNTWTTKATLSVGRGWGAAAGAGGKFYVFGGASTTTLNDCWEFDPVANTWTQKANMPGTREYHTAVNFHDTLIFVVGGSAAGGACDALVYKYHIASNTWTTETPMPTPRGWEMVNTVGNSIYATFGSDATTPTYLQVNEEGQLGPAAANDVGADAIISPPGSMNPGSVAPMFRIKNFGTNPQSNIPVYCWIDSLGTRVYDQNTTYPGPLASGDTATVTFSPNWNTGPVGNTYDITMFTALALDDENPANDTVTGTTMIAGATFSDTIVSPMSLTVPTLDGNIQAVEWQDANAYDISDTLGKQGTQRPPGSAFLYTKHDSDYMYWAVDMPSAMSRTDYDQIGIYIDEDDNNSWNPDSSEGNHWFVWLTQDTVIYRAWLGPGLVWIHWVGNTGCQSAASLTSGHMQFEMKVAFGTPKWNYNVTPYNWAGDTCGMHVYALDQPGDQFYGHWPTYMAASGYQYPDQFGSLIISPDYVGLSEGERIALGEVAEFEFTPNPMFRTATIRCNLAKQAQVNLGIYDASGSLVRTLLDEVMPRGSRVVSWDRTDRNGRTVANGTYFYRLTVDNRSITAKAVVLN